MKNSMGTNLTVTLFGESHGSAIGAVLDGLAPGIPVDKNFIAAQLALRQPIDRLGTARHEADLFHILSGVYRGRTTGTPLCIVIPNEDARSGDYAGLEHLPRPGHADYTAQCKYHGYQDPRGGGHFSGRLTAPLVAAGAVALWALQRQGISIGTHILRCGGISDRPFGDLREDITALGLRRFAALDNEAGAAMEQRILDAADHGDSVGGVLETAVIGLPAGVGEPWFDTVEGLLSHALFSIPAVKGVQFGDGFDMADATGSVFNDEFAVENGRIITRTNHNGGINGGITNGMPVLFRCMVKPTPSIGLPQQTVDLQTMTETERTCSGRHDPAILPRARVVVDSVAALVLADLLMGRFGSDYLGGDDR